MDSFLVSKFILVLCFVLCGTQAFIFDDMTTKSPPVGSVLTDKHYIYLMDMIHQERELREQYMLQFKQKLLENEAKIAALESTINQIGTNNGTVSLEEFHKLELAYKSLENSVLSLSRDNAELKKNLEDVRGINQNLVRENQDLQQLQNASGQRINDIEQELQQLKNLKALNELQEIQNIKNNVSALRIELNGVDQKTKSLDLTQQARAQDFLALYNQTKTVAAELPVIQTELIEQTKRLDALNGTVTSDREPVALTACASGKTVTEGQPMNFESVITSYGIQSGNHLSNAGYFSCDNPGLYLVSLTVMTDTLLSFFNIYKNSQYLVEAYDFVNQNSEYHGSSASVVVSLSSGDTVTVKPNKDTHIYGDSSRRSTCLTLVKVK